MNPSKLLIFLAPASASTTPIHGPSHSDRRSAAIRRPHLESIICAPRASRRRYKKGNDRLAGAKVTLLRALVRRCAAHLALVALTLQLVLSFAHLHVHVVAFARVGYANIDGAIAKRAWSRWEAPQQLPSGLADDDEHCTICFSSFLLSNSSIRDEPQQPAPPEFGDIDRSFNSVFDIVFEPRRAPFLSRAPPVA